MGAIREPPLLFDPFLFFALKIFLDNPSNDEYIKIKVKFQDSNFKSQINSNAQNSKPQFFPLVSKITFEFVSDFVAL